MLKFLPIMKGYAHEDKALTSQQNSGSIYSEVNCEEFSKVVSCSTWPYYFIYKTNSTNRVLHLKNIPSPYCFSGVGDFMQCLFLFVISSKVPQL